MLMLWLLSGDASPIPTGVDWDTISTKVILGTAVVMLWRALAHKGDLLQQAILQITGQAKVLEDLVQSIERLREEVMHLCVLSPRDSESEHKKRTRS